MKTKHLVLAACLIGVTVVAASAGISLPAPAKNQKKMKTFAVLVKVPVTYTAEQAKAVNPVWEKTISQWKEEGVYVTSFAFPGEGVMITGADYQVSHGKEVMNERRLVSCILLKTETLEQATEVAKSCPVLPLGGAVEVRELPAGIPQIY